MYEIHFNRCKCVVIADSVKEAIEKLLRQSPDVIRESITAIKRI